ncbi:FHA domain-containing protein [Dyella psychrodurans]|uniref:FHA domain-containing protein n=1 Tax=Dyella psychrodurans TaxID=1927960 RepID=UPI001F36735D|nr:FHA domain-containing protein [Dyella psychrodurans]
MFSANELSEWAAEAGPASHGRASKREPVLQGTNAGLEGHRFSLRAGRQTIGRRADNDIVVNEPSVSSAHAWIINQQGHYVVMNTLSTNGTFVNDQNIHEATIKHGDRVRFGQVEFVFLTRETRKRRRTGVIVLTSLLVLAGLSALSWWMLS